jgi:hypothetical protein
MGRSNEKGPGSEAPAAAAPAPAGGGQAPFTTIENPHYQNFVDAIRAGDPTLLHCDVLEGHLTSSLPHLGNIAYRVRRELRFDGSKEQFINDREADRLLTREYRRGFEIA